MWCLIQHKKRREPDGTPRFSSDLMKGNGSVRFQRTLGDASGRRPISQLMTELFGILIHAGPSQLCNESLQPIEILWLIGTLLSLSARTL